MNGLWTIFGPILTIVVAILSKNVILALFAGICYLSIGMNGLNFLNPIADYFIAGVNSNGMVLVLFIPMGIMLYYMRIGGGFKAFSGWAHKKVASRKQAGVMVFLLSAALACGSDLIGNMSTGKILSPVIRQNRLSPYKAGYITASVAPNLATPFPYGSYFMVCVGLIGMLVPGVNAIAFFFQGIALSIHTWLAILLALLAALEIVPDLGPIKRLQAEAAAGPAEEVTSPADISVLGSDGLKPDFGAFLIPLVVMVASMIGTSILSGEVVILPGAFIAAITAVVYTVFRGSVKPREIGDQIVAGILEVCPIILLLAFAFAFGAQLNLVGFSDFIVSALSGSLPPAVTPLICFLVAAAIGYTTGSLGSALIIMAPLALPLAGAVGANLVLSFAAVFSGSQWGDQTSPISDVLIENAGANAVDPVGLSKAVLPYRLIDGVACIVVFTLLGFIL